jgi:hypothetical protein
VSYSCKSCVSRPGGGICHSVLVVLRVRIWCAFVSITLLAAIVEWPGAASSDSFRDFAHRDLRNPVRGSHGD